MTNRRRIKELFLSVRQLPPEERERFLSESAGEDCELRQEVEALLKVEEQSPEFLQGPAEVAPSLASKLGDDDSARERIGKLVRQSNATQRYVHKGEIGAGGMGRILEVIDTDLDRRLVMKVIRGQIGAQESGETPGVDGRTMARFLEEAHIMGRLEHSGVVPVHELGADEEGRVYFTMRRVQGLDLGTILSGTSANKEEWSLPRVLGVLIRVGETMAFAHRNGVLHRDLKPANVMVGEFGEVYVMDWGLARLNASESSHRTTAGEYEVEEAHPAEHSPHLTQDGDVLGTPAYMPPEQARGELDGLGTWSDVYSLGAILFHLLAGHAPHVRTGEKPSLGVPLRRVRDEPLDFSEAISRAPQELVAICQKAMAREPMERYPNMGELVADLRAYEEGRVVRAHQTGAWVELVKWIRRNRVASGAFAAAGVALLLGGIVSLLLYLKAETNGQLARWESYVANLSAASMSLEKANVGAAQQHLERCPEELRSWEWKTLDLSSDQSSKVLEGHESGSRVSDVVVSPDGRRVFSAGFDRTLRMWDRETGELLHTQRGFAGTVRCVAISPDGNRIATGSAQDFAVRIWDVTNFELLAELIGHETLIWQVEFSPDGTRLFSRAWEDPEVVLWSIDETQPIARLIGHTETVLDARWSPDGQSIATASEDGDLRLWDGSTGELQVVCEGHEQAVQSVAFSNDGAMLVSTSADKTLRFWDSTTGTVTRKVDAPRIETGPTELRFSPNGQTVAWVEGGSSFLHQLDFVQGAEVKSYRASGASLVNLQYSPDGRLLVTSSEDGILRLWPMGRVPRGTFAGKPFASLEGHQRAVGPLAFSPDGSQIVSGSDDGSLRFWSPNTRENPVHISGTGFSQGLAIGPGGRHMVTSSWNQLLLWDLETGSTVHSVESGADGPVQDMDISPDGQRVVTGSGSGTVRIRELESLEILATAEEGEYAYAGRPLNIQAVAFSPDGDRLIYGDPNRDNTVVLADGQTGQRLASLTGHEPGTYGWGVPALAFAPDGSRIFTGSDDRTVRIWDSEDGSLLDTWSMDAVFAQREESGADKEIRRLSVSPNGKQLVTAFSDESLAIWNLESGQIESELRGLKGDAQAICFSPDGSRLATGSLGDGGEVRIWDPRTAESLLVLQGNALGVRQVRFTPDGSRLVTVGKGVYVRIWHTDLAQAHRMWDAFGR